MTLQDPRAGAAPQGRRTIPLAEVTLPHHCPRPVRMTVLDRSPYFHDLGAEALDRIDRRMRTSTWAAEEVIYRAGEPAGTLYVVADGRVRISQLTAAGTQTVTDILGPGDMFGAMSSLGEPHHLQTATALVGSCTLRIGQEAFREVMVENPTVGLRVVDDLAARLSRAETDIGGQGTDTVEQRVARALLRLADKLGKDRGAQGLLLEVPLSRADLAGLARSTPESVSRVMSRWKKAGIIDSGRRWTAVLDRALLEEAADGEG
ncbi:transcriptional regulator, Crp/Fnr family [Brachybacterium faecium]|uniref:cAMP-binding protein n=1 Tax=Brachybacterium faecium (strain ATCC 43885 / DSM 4810 / JCM 11609 / LMG 19847 / NBRC 14762 / NCIMB 9860 / 6-10) TaxID=446465 RepID=C7MFL8_BRAFD|nr:Crp/Fnr family transcriptional regulator [Brachybacterium faecium]ACU86235.1 cAMP-binding protein [Brachybacterium faecium DSM 4810]SLM94689.1 transcriptional regulator, Crp/Fnr family [Brachybacterium faecium]